MSPVVGVLVAMALMALLAALFTVCGVAIGATTFAPSDETPVAPTAQLVRDKQM